MNIVYILSVLCTSIWVPLVINILITKKLGIKRRIICVILQIIIYVIFVFMKQSEEMLLGMFLFWGMIVYFGMGKSKLQLVYIPVAYTMIAFCNYLFTWIINIFFDVAVEESMGNSQFELMSTILITPMIIAFAFVLKKSISVLGVRFRGKVSKEMTRLFICNIVLYTTVYLINSWAARNMGFPDEISNLNLLIFIAYTLLAIGNLILAFRVIRSQEQKKQEEEERKNLLEYTRQVESMYEELRSFRHDYVNILATLSGYLEKEDIQGMERYFEQNILPTSEKINQGNYHLQKLSKIQDPAIKGLISSKLIYAHNQGIDVFVDIVDEVNNIPIRTIDFTRIIGIYLDNAIEAALLSEKKEIKFNIVQEAHSVTIVLENTYVDMGISLSDIEKQGVSTKGEGRGLGLANVKKILREYANVCKQTEIKDGYFVQILIIEEKSVKR